MRLAHPQREQRRALQDEVSGVVARRNPVEQALDGKADKQSLEVLALAAGALEQARSHRLRVVLAGHDSASR